MSDTPTLFDLPSTPDQLGVVLPPADLRKIDFSGLDFTAARRAMIEYVQTYYPNDFNDFVASNGIIMLIEILASVTAKLSLRSDILANESTLPTAITEEAVLNHLALINQKIKRQTPAIVDVEITVDQTLFTDLYIPASTKFNITAPNNLSISYEIYRAPGDWTSNIVIPAGKRGIIAYGLEGEFVSPTVEISDGSSNQVYTITAPNILASPIFVTVKVGLFTEEWLVTVDPIERYGPTDKVVEVNFIEESVIFRFGDNVTGKIPPSGANLEFKYRAGGGKRGRVGIGILDQTKQLTPQPPANIATVVRFKNITPSIGGTDKETIAEAKRRAPRDYALQRSIVTADDYAQAATSFSHPVYGAVSKAVATIRTGLNANRVEIYVLAAGADGLLTKPNAGLKAGLSTYFSDLNVLTDHTVILDGKVKPIDINVNIIINRNADASVVKGKVEAAIAGFFDLSKWDMGQAFYTSNFIQSLESVDGVTYVDLLSPLDNIVPTGQNTIAGGAGIALEEIIVEGNRKTSYYYEKSPPPGGLRTSR